jgi:hypothetical protein
MSILYEFLHNLFSQALSQMPHSHRALFMYLCAFLRKLLKHNSQNNLDNKFLASLFGGLFLRTPSESDVTKSSSQLQIENRKKAAFIFQFLTNEYDEEQ